MLKTISLFILLALLANIAVYAELQTALNSGPVKLAQLEMYKRALAMDMASQLKNQDFRTFFFSRISSRTPSHDLVPLLRDFLSIFRERDNSEMLAFKNSVLFLDKRVREIKGISAKLKYILEVRMAFPDRRICENETLLVAYVPAGNEKNWKFVEAFDTEGNTHQLDVYKEPDKAVLVVGLNARNDMKAGLALLNEELVKAKMQVPIPEKRENLAVAKLDYIRLEDDKEPWVSGDAEIYALVSGIAPAANAANIAATEMPYLVEDKKDYYPGQVLIVWKNYRFMAANIVLYEHDDNTNYKEIAALLIKGIGQVIPEYAYIFEIASQIIRLMPDSIFTNDDDYVDVFYTIEKAKTYTNYQGASQNATITLTPYSIPEE